MKLNVEMNSIFVDYVMETDADIIWQIGGRYSGKTYSMDQLMAMNLAYKEKYKLLVVEDREGNVNQGTKAGILARIDDLQLDDILTGTKTPAEINSCISKNKAVFKGYSTEDQVKQVKALDSVTAAWYEEAENITKDQVEDLYFQLRGGNPEDRKLYLTLNPVNEYCYANEALIQTTPDEVLEYFPNSKRPKVFIKYVETEFEYEGVIQSARIKHLIVLTTHHDNKFLDLKQRAAIEALKHTDPEKYKQLAEARFTKAGGAYFQEFSREVHVMEPFAVPNEWRKYFVMDYGLDMLAGYWVAQDNQGKMYIINEVYESDLIISAAAERIKDMTYTPIFQHFAPPDLWNRRQETGKSAAELFQESGLHLTIANNNRIDGWLNVKEWLKPFPDEQGIMTANLQIFSNCENLIRCMSQIKRCDKRPNDVAKEPHELTHAPDALRYLLAGRPVPYIPKPMIRNGPNPYRFGTTHKSQGGFITWD